MPVAHDMTPGGRLMALLERCKLHAAQHDFDRLPGLLELIDQTDRVVRGAIREQMDAKQIEPQVRARPREEAPV